MPAENNASTAVFCDVHNTCYKLLHSTGTDKREKSLPAPLYLCPALFSEASGYSLPADSGAIWSLHLSAAPSANPPTVLKTAPGRISSAWSTWDVPASFSLHPPSLFHIPGSECCISLMCRVELCREGSSGYTAADNMHSQKYYKGMCHLANNSKWAWLAN